MKLNIVNSLTRLGHGYQDAYIVPFVRQQGQLQWICPIRPGIAHLETGRIHLEAASL